jgi:hypothetical protein
MSHHPRAAISHGELREREGERERERERKYSCTYFEAKKGMGDHRTTCRKVIRCEYCAFLRCELIVQSRNRCGMRNVEIKLQQGFRPADRNRAYLFIGGRWRLVKRIRTCESWRNYHKPSEYRNNSGLITRDNRRIGLQLAVQTAAAFKYQAEST